MYLVTTLKYKVFRPALLLQQLNALEHIYQCIDIIKGSIL